MELHAVVVGAGPAGLAAALTFGRMRRPVIVVDAGEPRNHYTDHLHNFPTRDGVSPTEFRRLVRAEVEHYPTVEFRDDRAVEARLEARGVPAGRIYRAADMLDDPHFAAREAIVSVPHPEFGQVAMQNVTPRLSATPGVIRSAGPELGAHNAEVWGGVLGLDDETLDDLRAEEII